MADVFFSKRRPPRMRIVLYVLMTLCVAVAVGLVMYADRGAGTRVERVDVLSRGPYLVEREVGGSRVFLAWVDTGRKLAPHIVPTWTTDLASAWRYATPESARSEAGEFGRVVALREVAG